MGSHTNKVWLQQRLPQFCFQCLILPEAVLRINMHSFQNIRKKGSLLRKSQVGIKEISDTA